MSRKPARARLPSTIAVSCVQTEPLWYDSGLNPASSVDMVRSPNTPASASVPSSRATCDSSSALSRPVPSSWPMLLVSESTVRLSRSSASAGAGPYGPSTQKAARNRRANPAACSRQRSPPERPNASSSRAPLTAASWAYP
ncbi:hypothetical protein [Micromonospora sp. NPDC005367]|uniref:hypothetical protein n=1 Tax=Micromonospora sp. NPDC005367 TaxID=3155590 RepID=UPI0033BBE91D